MRANIASAATTASTVDDLFQGAVVTAVPDAATEYARKAPGAYDTQGDHCAH